MLSVLSTGGGVAETEPGVVICMRLILHILVYFAGVFLFLELFRALANFLGVRQISGFLCQLLGRRGFQEVKPLTPNLKNKSIILSPEIIHSDFFERSHYSL